jgi:hypothetical protein
LVRAGARRLELLLCLSRERTEELACFDQAALHEGRADARAARARPPERFSQPLGRDRLVLGDERAEPLVGERRARMYRYAVEQRDLAFVAIALQHEHAADAAIEQPDQRVPELRGRDFESDGLRVRVRLAE